jgi:hypothetical protein
MWLHLASFLGRCWQAFRTSLGTTSLGFIAPLVVAGVSILATLYFTRDRHENDPMLGTALRVVVVVALLVFGPIFIYQALKTVYEEHRVLVARYQELAATNKQLAEDLEKHKQTLVTTDPAFANVTYLLQAFSKFRNALHGEPCVVRVTAPPEAMAMANMVAQLSIAASNCSTFGPDEQGNPDLDKQALSGMSPDFVIFHAAEDDKAAWTLFDRLSSRIMMKTSYDPPKVTWSPVVPRAHIVWLQFGTHAQWKSEFLATQN